MACEDCFCEDCECDLDAVIDVGPPAPGEFDPEDFPNPEIGMVC